MKFLVDQGLSPTLAQWLTSPPGGGHDAVHTRDRGLSGATDSAIFSLATAEARVIITADLDFARITALSGATGPGLILFRAGNITDSQMLVLLQRVLAEVDPEQLSKSVVVVDDQSIRVALLPIVRQRQVTI